MGLRALFGAKDEAPSFTVNTAGDRPDIVIFLTDEQRHDEVGYASSGYYDTPVLDALAARGTIFENAYSGSTVCVPSRGSLLTGLLHHRVPTQVNGMALEEGFFTVAHALRSAGYFTALVGKMHFFPMYAHHGFDVMKLAENLVPFSGYERGEVDDYHRFLLWQGRSDAAATHMFGPNDAALAAEFTANYSAVPFPYDRSLHPIGWMEKTALDVIRERPAGQPLFLVVSYPRPHAPYDPAEPYASMYELKDARIPEDGYGVNETLPDAFRQTFDRADRQRHTVQPVSRIPEDVLRRVLSYARGLIRHIDDSMGAILGALDAEKSVTFFTSDHGTYSGHRGLIGKVPWLPFDDLAKVALACRAPDGRPGARISAPVQSFDVAMTCLDYAGITPPPGVFDGVSLRPVLRGERARDDRAVFSCTSMGWPMIRKGTRKLVRRSGTGAEMLFDLERDPGETRSFLDDPAYASSKRELRALLDEALAKKMPTLPRYVEKHAARRRV